MAVVKLKLKKRQGLGGELIGYTTEFRGAFVCSRPLSQNEADYLRAFADTRRMRRSEAEAYRLDDPIRKRVSLPIGEEGCYFVGGTGFMGQDTDRSVMNHNAGPSTQPGLWCQWEPAQDENGDWVIVWNGVEKFYNYVEWIAYLVTHFLAPWGIELNGTVEWKGEEFGDIGLIQIYNNEVHIQTGDINYGTDTQK